MKLKERLLNHALSGGKFYMTVCHCPTCKGMSATVWETSELEADDEIISFETPTKMPDYECQEVPWDELTEYLKEAGKL